jgi:putative ABC transport system substrate-binding protein
MRRREFLGVLGAAAWPVGARAQQGVRVRRIGFLMNLDTNDPVAKARIAAFHQGLQKLGWIEGRNLKIEYRVTPGGGEDLRKSAAELVALAPELIVATGTPSVVAQKRATRNIPIVFVLVSDPVAAGLVDGLARPGGNVTGFTPFEYSTSAKWLELLKEIAPNVVRAAVMEESDNPGSVGQVTAIRSAAPALGMEITSFNGHVASEIERAIAAFATSPNGGLIVPAIPTANIHRDLLIRLAAQHRLPAVYGFRLHVSAGGLISYGPDQLDQYQQAARYVDRILKGEKPGELPVQTPIKYELAINLKTARALGLNVPLILQQTADEVIE